MRAERPKIVGRIRLPPLMEIVAAIAVNRVEPRTTVSDCRDGGFLSL
ncbi:hypothetical protein NXG27_02860 [Megasphaera paucivorans]|nr:hypothetical protein [Megasphaera paucivorans]